MKTDAFFEDLREKKNIKVFDVVDDNVKRIFEDRYKNFNGKFI